LTHSLQRSVFHVIDIRGLELHKDDEEDDVPSISNAFKVNCPDTEKEKKKKKKLEKWILAMKKKGTEEEGKAAMQRNQG
jgi:hypothetical protein